jgi:glycosyltransferase involved in cell wall biosynthesis
MAKISIAVPCYNEESTIEIFYQEMLKIEGLMPSYDFEYIFIDDGSKDSTLKVLSSLHQRDGRVKYISFSRNFGKESAIYAGLSNSTGDYTAVMDVDLQDPPSLLPEMMSYIIDEHYDSVATRRVDRKGEPVIRSFFARRFYHLINKISDIELVDGARDYRLMTRKFVDAVLSLSEYNRFSKGLFEWVGFKTKWIEFNNVERSAGETKWSFWKLFKYSIEGIMAFSTLPLYLSSLFGAVMCFVSFIFITFIIVRQLCFGGSAPGWPSMVCIITLIGGIIMLCIGVLGMYLSKMYLEIKKRPLYISKEECLSDDSHGESKETK